MDTNSRQLRRIDDWQGEMEIDARIEDVMGGNDVGIRLTFASFPESMTYSRNKARAAEVTVILERKVTVSMFFVWKTP